MCAHVNYCMVVRAAMAGEAFCKVAREYASQG